MKLTCRSWGAEAMFRMLQHNVSPGVAEKPEELIVYGGTGRAARNWECFEKILATLQRLGDDETLLIQSGKPVGVFRTHADAPRGLLVNSQIRGRNIYRTLIFLSYPLMVVAVGIIWRWLYDEKVGLINYLLRSLGIDPDEFRNRPVNELSVGQQQRVAAARALIGKPSLLIADEPTSSLDSDARHAFVRLLHTEARQSNATIVFVSHDRSLESEFDRVVELSAINRVASTVS